MIFYDDGNAKNGNFNWSSLSRMNPNSVWATHSYNHFVLTHIFRNGNTSEKMQASKELEIAERKMKFWSRQPGFDETVATNSRIRMYRM